MAAGLLGAALLVAAGLLDAEPLYVPATGLLLLALAMGAWTRTAAQGATVSRELDATRVLEGAPLTGRVVARAGATPFPGGEVREALLDQPVGVPGGGRVLRFRFAVRFARRGLREPPAPELIVRDPLGVSERRVVAAAGTAPARVLVLPRTEPVEAGEAGGELFGAGGRRTLTGAAETELDGLREYRPGTPATRIHWAALARRGRLFERHLHAEADARPLVALDARGPAGAEALDAAVRAAASLCLALARAGGCSALLPGDRRAAELDPGLAAWPDLHARLALVQAGPAPVLAMAGTRTGPILYVAARGARPRGLERPPAGSLLVVPRVLPGAPAAFTVAGCHAYALTGRPARRAVAG
ncbi:MAG TPA: DUF58 domain-containing protein [Solirubrobacteraceae bacterium]|nr:DUF58 domain-containing protein [Solirubrobacteraceae bacterium]